MAEREEIIRGVAAGASVGQTAATLGRSASTVSREIARNGGRDEYRAASAERRAADAARRPQRCKLSVDGVLRDLVAGSSLRTGRRSRSAAGWR